MLSFHSDPAIKEKYLTRVIAHRKADNIIQGTGWVEGRGCAVGCTLENYDPSLYPVELGLPEWLARLEDIIFESLPEKDAVEWPEKFLEAIAVGVNVEMVRPKLAIRRLDRLIVFQKSLAEKNPSVKEAIEQVIAALDLTKQLHQTEINEPFCNIESAWSAESAARSAARSAWIAGRGAAESAAKSAWIAANSAWIAANSAAESAGRTANSAANSARGAAWSSVWGAESANGAAERASYKQEASDLLELLKECV